MSPVLFVTGRRSTSIEEALGPISILNAWARCPYDQMLGFDCRSAIYWMKNRVILAALGSGVCDWRTVQVTRKCLTCKGTGMFEWEDWGTGDIDYRDCRRCDCKGEVVLRFIETSILGRKFHTPSNRADFLRHLRIDWEKCSETDWVPQQPGCPLERRYIIRLLNEAERAICGDRMLRWHGGWRGSVTDYSLNLGEFKICFVCQRPAVGWSGQPAYLKDIHRPGLKWKQAVCRTCEDRAGRWPRQWPASLFPQRWARGQWINEDPAWPMCAPLPAEASNDHVTEWLRRRGIEIGAPVPGELFYYLNTFSRIVAVRDGAVMHEVADSQDFRYMPAHIDDHPTMVAPVGHFSALPRNLLAQPESGGEPA